MVDHSIFELRAAFYRSGELTVVSFHGVEQIGKPFSFEILLAGKGVDVSALDRDLLGQRAQLILGGEGEAQRSVCGIVRRLEAEGTSGGGEGRHRFRAWLAPRLWLLSKKRNSRVFQEKTVQEIVDQVLAEWSIPRRWTLLSTHKPRDYCVQYQETDLGFVQRLLAEEGIFYSFEPPNDETSAEMVVFSDNVHLWSAIAGAPSLEMHDSGGMKEREQDVRRFRVQERVRSGSVHLKEFDFVRPSIDLSARAHVRLREGAFDMTAGRVYDHHGEFERRVDTEAAERHLEQHRAQAKVGVGESRCRRLRIGSWFDLRGCPLTEHDGRYAILRVEHQGRHPEVAPLAEEARDVYKNAFWCVPLGAPVRPRRPRRRIRQVMETATVVGPAGHAIHTDHHGRIKVQFHWDLEGKHDEHSSCWIRTMQTWAGTGWGFQFLPRIGMEVLVMFTGGDVDRPMVVGCAYNGEHPTPFQLPMSKTRSGIRTQSTPGNGYNEISFEDHGGDEEISIHAQKNLDTKILNNQSTQVGADRDDDVGRHEFARVGGNSMSSVGGDCSRSVAGDDTLAVDGSKSSFVRGNLTDRVDGSAERRVTGDQDTRIEGRERHTVEGASDLAFNDEVTVRVGGSVATVIGRHDARRSHVLHVEGISQFWSSKTTQIASESEIVIECGKSSIRLGPERIELHAPSIVIEATGSGASFGSGEARLHSRQHAVVASPDSVQLKSSGAGVIVDSDVKIVGPIAHVEQPDPNIEPMKKGAKPTKIEIVDDEGNPIPYQRYRIIQEDGSVLGGMSDKDGKGVVELKASAFIEFPGLSEVEKT